MDSTKKCSRCRGKRLEETEFELFKYSTCGKCRNKRKITRQMPDLTGPAMDFHPSMYHRFSSYLEELRTNKTSDLSGVRFVERVNTDEFPVYTIGEIDQHPDANEFYSAVSKKLVRRYIEPISAVTGYKFPIRDYHKGGIKTKKMSLVFICCQDKTKQRKSRSKQNKRTTTKLKIYNCFSKVSLNYDLLTGAVALAYSHKCHRNSNTVAYDDITAQPELLRQSATAASGGAAHDDIDVLSSSIQSIAAAAVENKLINIDDRLLNS